MGLLFPVLAGAATVPTPSITALQSEISLSHANGVTTASVVLVAKSVSTTAGLQPTITLIDATGVAKVEVSAIEELGSGASGKVWQVRLDVDGIYPGESAPVVLVARLGDGGPFAIPVKLTSPPVREPIWRLLPPASRWLVDRNSSLEFSVATDGIPIDDVTIVHAAVERSDGQARLVSSDFALTRTTCSMPQVGRIEAGPPVPLYLCLAKENTVGNYSGLLHVAALPSREPKSIAVSLAVTSRFHQWVGIGAMVAGLLLSYIVLGFLQRRAARLNALLPASVLLETLAELEEQHASLSSRLGVALDASAARLTELSNECQTTYLSDKGFLPSSNVLSLLSADVVAYKAHLASVRLRMSVVDSVFAQGLELIAAEWTRLDPANQSAAEALVTKIDEFARADDRKTLVKDLQAQVAQFEALKRTIVKAQSAVAPVPTMVAPRSVTSMQIELGALGMGSFLIWTAITLLVGWQIWIAGNPGFGLWTDWVTCFFWGLGLPTAGSKLQQLTPASTQALFRVSVPKAKG